MPNPSYDLDTDQGKIISETLRKVVQTFNQTLFMESAGNTTNNLDSNNVLHDNSLDRQSVYTLNTNAIPKQTIPAQKDSYKLDPTDHIRTDPITKRTEQIIMDIDVLSHLPKLGNKIFQKLNLNGLYQYSNTCKAYIFEKSNYLVSCSYMFIF